MRQQTIKLLWPLCRQHPHGCRRRAFTLVELIASMVILAVIGTIASRTIVTAMDGCMRAATEAQLHAELSIAMEQIERELRNIPARSAGVADITSITASSITWNGNSSFTISNGQLRYSAGGATPVMLLNNVTAFSVKAFDRNNAELAATLSGSNCDPVQRIRVQITVERSGVSQSLHGKIFVRSTATGAEL